MKSKLVDKRDFIKGLSEDELKSGSIVFDLPGECKYVKKKEVITGYEYVYGYVSKEDMDKYFDDDYYGEITAILLSNPTMDLENLLHWGIEVTLQCRGPVRAVLSTKWLHNYVYNIN